MITVGVIGTGKIAAPMVRSILRRKPAIQVVVSPRSAHVAEDLANSSRVRIAKNNQGVLDSADIVLLCMLSEVAKEVVPSLEFGLHHRVVSVMVDYTVDELLADCSPATCVELTMPLPFIETGGCPLPCYPTGRVVSELFGDENSVTVLQSVEAMQPHIAVAGVLSAFLQSVAEISLWLGAQTGKSQEAESHVVDLLAGYLHAIPRDGDARLKQAIDQLSTKGGLNAQYLQALTEAGNFQATRTQLDSLLKRLNA